MKLLVTGENGQVGTALQRAALPEGVELMALGRDAQALGFLSRRPRINPIPTSEYPTPARRLSYSVLNTSEISETFGVTIRPWRHAVRDILNEVQANH
ncbi:MAG: sugar nucleotide-binding protein [Alphaproteobacteria bacterium]|nr:sugar nucleotide-binding protein [Alphaproteobacteria bacterium]